MGAIETENKPQHLVKTKLTRRKKRNFMVRHNSLTKIVLNK